MAYSIEQFQALNMPETIIDEYPEDTPYPSCLILGKSNEKNLHICASINDGMIYVITSYIPDPAKWEADLKTRKEGAK